MNRMYRKRAFEMITISVDQPEKKDRALESLTKLHVSGMTVTEVRGHGQQKGHTAVYRGKEYNIRLLPKMSIETVVQDDDVGQVDLVEARGFLRIRLLLLILPLDKASSNKTPVNMPATSRGWRACRPWTPLKYRPSGTRC